MAGSICPVEVMKRCIQDMHMEAASIAYGMTETSPVSCQTRTDDDLERRTASIGRVHPHVEIKIVDPVTGETVERGAAGRVLYARLLGDARLLGRPREDLRGHRRRRLDAHRRPRRDARGRLLNIVGRIKDMVIRGGENVYPREWRSSSTPTPPSGRAGDRRPRREVRRGAGRGPPRRRRPLDADAVRAYATGKLAHYKIPRYVLLVDEFPMTVTGKIRKVQMREETAARARPRRHGPRRA